MFYIPQVLRKEINSNLQLVRYVKAGRGGLNISPPFSLYTTANEEGEKNQVQTWPMCERWMDLSVSREQMMDMEDRKMSVMDEKGGAEWVGLRVRETPCPTLSLTMEEGQSYSTDDGITMQIRTNVQ